MGIGEGCEVHTIIHGQSSYCGGPGEVYSEMYLEWL